MKEMEIRQKIRRGTEKGKEWKEPVERRTTYPNLPSLPTPTIFRLGYIKAYFLTLGGPIVCVGVGPLGGCSRGEDEGRDEVSYSGDGCAPSHPPPTPTQGHSDEGKEQQLPPTHPSILTSFPLPLHLPSPSLCHAHETSTPVRCQVHGQGQSSALFLHLLMPTTPGHTHHHTQTVTPTSLYSLHKNIWRLQ